MKRAPRRMSACIGAFALALLGAAGALAGSAAVQAVDVNGQLQDQGLQARFESITKELRCLVCQNESIADSNVELASDLRRQVSEMLVAGKSDDAIFDFMTDRYGEFVRFAPPRHLARRRTPIARLSPREFQRSSNLVPWRPEALRITDRLTRILSNGGRSFQAQSLAGRTKRNLTTW